MAEAVSAHDAIDKDYGLGCAMPVSHAMAGNRRGTEPAWRRNITNIIYTQNTPIQTEISVRSSSLDRHFNIVDPEDFSYAPAV